MGEAESKRAGGGSASLFVRFSFLFVLIVFST